MAVPVSNSVSLTGNPRIDGLVQGGSWRFGDGPRTLTYSFSRAFDTDQAPGTWTTKWRNAVDKAFDAWEAVANVEFVRVGGIGTQFQNQSTADIALSLERLAGEIPFAGIGMFPSPSYASRFLSQLGYSRNSGEFPWPRPEGDIAFVSNSRAFNSLSAGSFGYNVVMHEIGHALGLKHPDDDGGNSRPTFRQLGIGSLDAYRNTLMTSDVPSNISSNLFPSTPMPLDILAIQRIYGANMSYRTGDDVYRLKNNAQAISTIWDAGGTDVIDASGLSSLSSATIDLNQGKFSQAGGIIGQIAIAYNVVIENAIGSSGNDGITGNAADNNLSGEDGNDTINGGDGNDTLDGGGGIDVMNGGDGDDTLIAGGSEGTGGSGFDVLNGGNGNDTIHGEGANEFDDSPVGINGGAGNDTISLTRGTAHGGSGADTITVTGISRAELFGDSGSDTLVAGNGGNLLDGGTGADTLIGGLGHDIHVVDDSGDIVNETAGGGSDTVRSSVNHVLGANVESLVLIGTSNLNGSGNSDSNLITGNSGANVLNGAEGSDILKGGAGNDTYVLDSLDTQSALYVSLPSFDVFLSSPSVSVFDNTPSDGLIDSLSFDLGTFALRLPANEGFAPGFYTDLADPHTVPGQGGITVNVSSAIPGPGSWLSIHEVAFSGSTLTRFVATAHIVQEENGARYQGAISYSGEPALDLVFEAPDGGIDTVETPFDYRLPLHVENLTFTGTDNINGTGNALANVLTGNDGINTLTGGLGNDTYVIQNSEDVVVEDAGEGTDTLSTPFTTSLEGTHLENLTLTGSDNIDGTGTASANVLTGNDGINTLSGGQGNDTYVIQNEGDVIVENENEGIDTVVASISYSLADSHLENLTLAGSAALEGTGNELNNVLTGNAAASTLAGGLGEDTYIVTHSAQVIVESTDGGVDSARSAVSYTLGANVERLTLTGSSDINAAGNTLDNALTGNSGDNVLDGKGGADTIKGGSGNDTLVWSSSDLLFDGGSGTDTLRVDGAKRTLNLRTVDNDVIKNVELIDITGSGKNRLELTYQDVLDLSSTTNTLRVHGNAGDVVDRNGGWTRGADRVIGGETYHSYTQGLATLLVDTEITGAI